MVYKRKSRCLAGAALDEEGEAFPRYPVFNYIWRMTSTTLPWTSISEDEST